MWRGAAWRDGAGASWTNTGFRSSCTHASFRSQVQGIFIRSQVAPEDETPNACPGSAAGCCEQGCQEHSIILPLAPNNFALARTHSDLHGDATHKP